MRLKINNINLLNENDYDRVIIKKRNNGYHVSVKRVRESVPKMKGKNKWSSNLRRLDDVSKLKEIINYHLEYTTINKIREEVVLPYYGSIFTEIGGNRTIYLDMHSCIFNDIKKNVRIKYYNDREKTIENNKDINYYSISASDESSYKIIDDGFVSTMEIKLLSYQNGINGCRYLDDVENLFLKDFLWDKFYKEDQDAKIENQNLYNEEDENYVNLGYFVTCGNLTVSVDKELLPNVVNVVENYNKEREKEKSMQLKLEGF